MGLLADKVAVITGASKGIGAEIARLFAAEGASVIVHYGRDQAGADKVVAQIERAGGMARAVKANIASPQEVASLFQSTRQAFGKLDILVNNAGIYKFGAIGEFSEEKYREQFDINVLGVLLATKEAVASFGDAGGSIINLGSVASRQAPATAAIYAATKSAVETISRALSKELGPRKIRVNTISPGGVETEGTHTADMIGNEFEAEMIRQTPLGRFGRTTDIAPVALFLASDASQWISGENIFVSGGLP